MSELKAKFDLNWLSKIADFIKQSAEAMGCHNDAIISDLQLAVDEASTNLIKHAQSNQKKDYFIIRMSSTSDQKIEIEITDFGPPFDFESKKLPSKDLPLEEKLKIGFGIGFIKAVTEDANYQTYPNKNVLRFFKPFPQEEQNGHSRKEG